MATCLTSRNARDIGALSPQRLIDGEPLLERNVI